MSSILTIYPFIIGSAVAAISGVLGCFVIWRRMAYFGDSLAHSALLGVALGLLYGFDVNIGIIAICLAFAVILVLLQHKRILATDTLLGIMAHSGLAIGMVFASFIKDVEFDLHDYLFGDVLAVNPVDINWVLIGGAIVLILIIKFWSSLTLMAINEDMARAEGVNAFWMQLLFMIMMAAIVAFSVRIVGVLLVTSLLIIPAAAARQIVKSPESMALMAALIGILSVIIGIFFSVGYALPSGPTIVSVSTAIFAVIFSASLITKKK